MLKRLENSKNTLLSSVQHPSFDLLNDTDKTLFLFSDVDSFTCKKLGYFVYEALHIREDLS